MLLSIEEVESTGIHSTFADITRIHRDQGIVYGLAVLSRCFGSTNWDSAIIHDTPTRTGHLDAEHVLRMEALPMLRMLSRYWRIATASEMYQESLDFAKRLEHPAGHLVASWGIADLAEIETRYDDALLALSDSSLVHATWNSCSRPSEKRLHDLTALGEGIN